ncbi:MAG TPA: inositol-3-phosphate synthase, partial [Actinoplanes sp.]|nr:inositol-3-phosphate synthase [Actinoplanes sp.]
MRTGIWLIGARGSVATTATVGALAIKARLADSTGCVTELPAMRSPALPGWSDLVIGGHDVVATPVLKKAESLAFAGVLPGRLVSALTDELTAHEQSLRPLPACPTKAETAAAIASDIADFAGRHDLSTVVVINVATTEPIFGETVSDPSGIDRLPPSSLAAFAAFTAGCGFVDFTPSPGARLDVLHDL